MREIIVDQPPWRIDYVTNWDIGCEHWNREAIVLSGPNGPQDHWHPWRFWARNRTIAECIVLALTQMQRLKLAQIQQEAELTNAREFAQQLLADGLLEP